MGRTIRVPACEALFRSATFITNDRLEILVSQLRQIINQHKSTPQSQQLLAIYHRPVAALLSLPSAGHTTASLLHSQPATQITEDILQLVAYNILQKHVPNHHKSADATGRVR
jgi:hypothetical protein